MPNNPYVLLNCSQRMDPKGYTRAKAQATIRPISTLPGRGSLVSAWRLRRTLQRLQRHLAAEDGISSLALGPVQSQKPTVRSPPHVVPSSRQVIFLTNN